MLTLPRGIPRTVFALLACSSCATPPPLTFDPDAASASLAGRVEGRGALDASLDLVDVPSAVFALAQRGGRDDPLTSAFWDARTLAFAPPVREAKRAWRTFRESIRSAGAPEPAIVRAVDHQIGGEDKLFESIGLFDLFGHLGLGPARAERALAIATEAEALARLDAAAWEAIVRARSARVELASIRRRMRAIEPVLGEARADLERVEILESRDRIGAAPAGSARAMVAALERRLSLLENSEAGARRRLAVLAGLDVDDPALDVPGTVGPLAADLAAESRALAGDSNPIPRAHPALVAAELRVLLEEARVRSVAAASWPRVRLGPHVGFPDGSLDGDVRIGGLLQLELPFPSSWRGRLAAAVEARESAVEAYTEVLLELRSTARDATTRARVTQDRQRPSTATVVRAASEAWTAARAAFRVGRTDLEIWMRALEQRTESGLMPIDDLEALARAQIDLDWALAKLDAPSQAEVLP